MSPAYRILVADSDREALEAHRAILLQAGYEVVMTIGTAEVLPSAEKHQPDLVLLALRTHGDTGLEACSKLKAHSTTASIPTIFISDDPDPDTMIRAFAVGASDYLQTPVRSQELLARISVHVRLRRAEQELLEKNEQTAGLAKRLTEVNAELALLSRLDPLTQLLNRRAWQESANIEHERSMRYGHTYGLIMIDVDFFKAYNDLHGHQSGDECLRQVASIISNACRRIDLAGRYGGEEFVVLAPEIELPQLRMLSERIRKSIWDAAMPHSGAQMGRRVTISAGCALSRPNTALADTISLADQSLYFAKHSGRNRVCMHGASPLSFSGAPLDEEPGPQANSVHADLRVAASILLATGDEAIQRQFERVLETAGFKVSIVTQGFAVLGRASANRPDIVLLDTAIPRLGWKDCVDQLRGRTHTADIPVVVIGSEDKIEEYSEWGLDGFVSAKVPPDDLIFRLRTLVRLYRSRSEVLVNYEQRGEQARIMSLLLDFCRHLVTLNDLDEVLDRTLLAALELTGCRSANILLPSTDGSLYLARSVGDQPSDLGDPASVVPEFVQRVFQLRQAMTEPFEPESRQAAAAESAWHARSPALCQVLDTPSEAVGVLTLFERPIHAELDARELECVEVVSQIAASAIQGLLTREAHKRACDSIVVALAKLAEYRDNDTGRHLERVTHYCVMLAEQLAKEEKFVGAITQEFISDLERAVPLHDIGKVAVPDSILLKPGRLTPQEMKIMQTHAEIGADTIHFVCRSVPQATFLNMAEVIARAHHERFDGEGYPAGLAGEIIPLAARITALADVYDALTTKRVYKEAMTHEEAVRVITAGSGTQFDPEIVEAFLDRESDFAAWAQRLADDHLPYRTSAMELEHVLPVPKASGSDLELSIH